jgi:hypothetical protein
MTDDPFGICGEPECGDGGSSQDLPSFTDMIKSLTGTTSEVVRGVLNGDGLLVLEDIYNERMAICNGCSYFRKDDKRCTKCGCFMEAKTRLKKTYCPIDKWEAII